MKKDLALVILAAGMGSRFGGLKQIEPIGPHGEFIIDYSIYDAIQAGFSKVVFIIKEENYQIFRDTIGKRIEGKIPVEYVFQDIKNIPEGLKIPTDRTKPWGTAHAILSCKDVVNTNFVMINADDFYGRLAYMKMRDFFDKTNDSNCYSMVAFKVANTITENGSVKRGVCESYDNYLTKIVESSISKVNNEIIAIPLDSSESYVIKPDTLVSMNFFGFSPKIFETLEQGIITFFEKNKDKLLKCEYLIPDVIFEEIKKDKKVYVMDSSDKWLGVTYKEDKEFVVNEVAKLIEKGVYPNDLWK